VRRSRPQNGGQENTACTLAPALGPDGDIVDVVTIFSGKPSKTVLSDAAKKFHSSCFLDDDAMSQRKREDKRAQKIIGANPHYLNYKEALYRRYKKENIYPNLEDIYHIDYEKDLEIINKLSLKIEMIIKSYDIVFAPMGLGNHADHLLTNKAILEIKDKINNKLYFYEEVPYACYYYLKNNNSNWGKGMKEKLIYISDEEWNKKIKAIKMYRSQLNIMWKNQIEMLNQLDNISQNYSSRRSIRIWYY
jgi:LmbE family N-acetylglucosaminyl deacetylase